MTISTEDRSKMRAALLEKGVKTRGLTGEDLVAAYKSHCEGTPAPTPSPSPKTPEQPPQTPQEPPQKMTTPTRSPDELARTIADMISAYGQPEAPAMDEARIVELINEHATKTIQVERAGQKEPVKIEGAHESFERVLNWLKTGTNVYLVGPAGSGKTTMAIQAAKALGLEFHSTGSIMASYELMGFRDANGSYHASALRRAYEHGGLFLFDEIDGSSAKALITFNQLLENDRYTFPDGVVERHPDFCVIAGANTVGNGATRQYIGRNPLDGASKDRFVMVEIQYDKKLEQRMAEAEYKAHGGENMATLQKWLDRVRVARRKLADMGSQAIVSPRASKLGARGLAVGLSFEDVTQDVLLADLSADQRSQLAFV